jgi:hypothetical protein
MPDQFDFQLVDEVLLAEVELLTALMVVAGQSDERLSQPEIDRILGVTPVPRVPAPRSGDVERVSPQQAR